MDVKCKHCQTGVSTELALPGTTVLEEFSGAAGERALDRYNTFVTQCLYRTLLIYGNFFSGVRCEGQKILC